ncbi:putative Chorismate mutase [Rhodotorula taiwanensis]|uniref:Chorismate mutase n=1 Tax=Rhodotorula taiwanensis TaxID=741276 RepID=A0A2S5BIA7_9BASI|nr:putative Chorismate mutase [Rhodotorula taiwanensis]
MNFMTPGETPGADPLDLASIRGTLTRLEDTIIFLLIERASFAYNPRIYDPQGFADLGLDRSWINWLLRETETVHAKIRRYDSPDEHPFTARDQLPSAILPPLEYPPLLYDPTDINVNERIMDFYVGQIVPSITRVVTEKLGKVDDDGNYGSAATRDLDALQAMSRRIHYGMFVSESKFRSAPADFVPHILNPNPSALLALITKPEVEAALLRRLDKKARWYGAELGPEGDPVAEREPKVQPEEVVRLYEEYIIPLTKDVEVEYLLHRLDGLSQAEIDDLVQNGTASKALSKQPPVKAKTARQS